MSKTALIVVDMQNDFAHPKGALYVKGGETLVPLINGAIDYVRPRGFFDLVVYTQDWHPVSTPHFEKWPVHCVEDTWGGALHPELRVEGPVFRKGTGQDDGYSGFEGTDSAGTDLLSFLNDREVEVVTVVGLALDYCVKATAFDAKKHFRTVKVSTTLAIDPNKTDEVFEELRAAHIACPIKAADGTLI